MGVALSTSWNAFRHRDAKNLLFEIEKLGFKEAELSFNLTASMVKGILRLNKHLSPKIVSLHNYCPIPCGLKRSEALPDCYSLASCDLRERRLAVKYTKKSIDSASSLGAKAVVLHCGRVELPDRTRELINLCEKGLRQSKKFRILKSRMIKERKGLERRFLNHLLSSLDELNLYARNMKILLGIETRFYYREIPTFEEIGVILKEFKGSNLRYWHDTGHAQVMQNLGLARHKDFLESYSREMLGIHLHDLIGCQDHHSPLAGELDFRKIVPYLQKDTLKVIEAHWPATANEIVRAKEYLEKIL